MYFISNINSSIGANLKCSNVRFLGISNDTIQMNYTGTVVKQLYRVYGQNNFYRTTLMNYATDYARNAVHAAAACSS